MAFRENISLGKAKIRKPYLLDAEFSIGAEAANVINVAVQLKDPVDGKPIDRAVAVPFYLSSDSAGQVLEATGPTSIAIGTDGVVIPNGGDSKVAGMLVSEEDGDIDIDITLSSGADTFYLNLVMPDGRIVTSAAITFAA